jgi:hypothetical protein
MKRTENGRSARSARRNRFVRSKTRRRAAEFILFFVMLAAFYVACEAFAGYP